MTRLPAPSDDDMALWFQIDQARLRIINNVAAIIAAVFVVGISLTLNPRIDDFKQYWQAAINIRALGDPYATTVDLHTANARSPAEKNAAPLGYPNPPLLAYLMLPMARLPHATAQLVWFACNCAMLAVLIALIIANSGSRLPGSVWGIVALMICIAPPTRLSLQLGQVSILLALLVLLSYVYARRQPAASGVLIGLAFLIKLFPGLIALEYLLIGPRRAGWWAIVSTFGIVLATLALHGLTPYAMYLNKVLLGGFYPYAAEFNISIVGFWQRLFIPHTYGIAVADAPLLAQIAIIICSVGILGTCISVRSNADSHRLLLCFCMWLCAMLLIAPINGYYNLVIALFPIMVLLGEIKRTNDRGLGIGLLAACLLVAIPPGWSDFNQWIYQTVHVRWGLLLLTPSLYGLLLLFALVVRSLRRSHVAVQPANDHNSIVGG